MLLLLWRDHCTLTSLPSTSEYFAIRSFALVFFCTSISWSYWRLCTDKVSYWTTTLVEPEKEWETQISKYVWLAGWLTGCTFYLFKSLVSCYYYHDYVCELYMASRCVFFIFFFFVRFRFDMYYLSQDVFYFILVGCIESVCVCLFIGVLSKKKK